MITKDQPETNRDSNQGSNQARAAVHDWSAPGDLGSAPPLSDDYLTRLRKLSDEWRPSSVLSDSEAVAHHVLAFAVDSLLEEIVRLKHFIGTQSGDGAR